MRLAAAELTDVGRRRERNQDNVAHLVPDDPKILEARGALFVVCDGMGGHAAGEVASELGVKSIRETYYANRETNIISLLAGSIETANDSIYSHAREHPELAGMGTTVVAAVVVDGRAYIVNIGDSRAYLVRDGQMRQITRDHSWVAEQVRVGLLTEEQARTHSHRNVITRSLGTQPSVTADLFVETVQDGDRMLLCSDGLHGYVEEADIEREMTSHDDPQKAVQNLVDMANNNGGPDNITALVVQLLEVPAPSGEIVLPSGAMAQGVTQPLPAAVAAGSSPRGSRPAATARRATPVVAPAAKRSSGSSGMINAIRILAAVIVVAILVSVWYLQFGPYAAHQAANARALADVTQAQQAATQAQSQSPAAALAQLSGTRQTLMSDLNDSDVEAQNKAKVTTALDQQVQPAIQQAIQRYNASALITPIAAGVEQHAAVQCTVPNSATTTPLSNATALVQVATPTVNGKQPPKIQVMYALDGGKIDQVRVPTDDAGVPNMSQVTCVQMALPANVATVVALTVDGTSLYALAESATAQYSVIGIFNTGLNPDGTPKTKVQGRFNVPTVGGTTPNLISVQGATTWVSYVGDTTNGPGIWVFVGNAPKGPSQTLLLAQAAHSLLFTNNTLYVLLADGSLGQVSPPGQFVPLTVSVSNALAPVTSTDYTIATPVPVITPTATAAPIATAVPTATPVAGATATPTAPAAATSGTFFPGGVLVSDPTRPSQILISDGTNNRVVRFLATPTPGLAVLGQYVYGKGQAGGMAVAVTADTTNLHIFSWSQSQLVTYPVPLAVA